jgi:hypothetical protein
VNRRFRDAFENEPVPNDLEAQVRARLAQSQPSRGLDWKPVAGVSMLVLVLVLTQYYAGKKIVSLLRIGLDDHVHCAIAGVYPHQTQRVEMIDGLGPQFAPMLQPVIDQASLGRPTPDAVQSAHRCTVNGRSYVHIILRRDGVLISVILTRRSSTEVFPRAIAARVVHASGITLHDDSLDGYAVSGFESGAWLGYVISGLPAPENDALSARLAPVVRRFAL